MAPIHYACQDQDHIYLAMPLFAKGSLEAIIATKGLTLREVITFGTQFLSGLHHVHSKGLIHFDVKPANILLSSRREAILSDFGLAKPTAHDGRAGQDRIYGNMTPPEAFDTDHFTNRFDIYQAGLTLYRMCVGDREFRRQFNAYFEQGTLDRHEFQHAVRNGQFPDRDSFPDHVPIRLRRAICAALSVAPADRPSSALAVINEFAEIDGNQLDWEFDETGDGRHWTKRTEGRTCELLVRPDGSSLATRTSAAGRLSRINAYCLDRITVNLIRRFLGDF